MHVPTHILSGWCLGNCVRLTPRERLGCMVAAAAPDLDGVGRVFGEEAYWRYHHVLGHNWVFIAGVAIALCAGSGWRWKAFGTYVLAGHLHLVMDYFGSGPHWGMHYFWPFSDRVVESAYVWELYSWQNLLATLLLLGWTVWIAVRRGRTPVETITPELDRRIVRCVRGKSGRGTAEAGAAEA